MSKSNIEWTEKTWNPLAGCTRVSEGCDNCYAAGMALRLEAMALKDIESGKDPGGKSKYVGIATRTAGGRAAFNGVINLDEDAITAPTTWYKPAVVFVNSMSDLFHKDVPDEFLDRIFLVMRGADWHTFQVLTKRPERMKEYINSRWVSLGLAQAKHIWLGTSIENQATADVRLPALVNTRAHVRFVSAEPLLGAVDLSHWLQAIHWVIVGGESGSQARPMHINWARAVRDQCQAEGTKFFFKQWGEWVKVGESNMMPLNQLGKLKFMRPDGSFLNKGDFLDASMIGVWRAGKKAAGRLLDGREWNEMPGKEGQWLS